MGAALAHGFADPVFDGQVVFRAALSAFSRPGVSMRLPAALAPPDPLTPELAALALALADPDAPLWLDPALAASGEVAAYLRFHTGARLVETPADAAFALVSDPSCLPSFGDLAIGTDPYPDRSTTVIVAVPGFAGGLPIALVGPGIRGSITIAPLSLPADFPDRLRGNAALFPRGTDILLVATGQVQGIPRSSRVVGEVA